jgi:urea transport system substrate-binding protein
MKRTPISSGIQSILLTLWLSFAVSTVDAAEDTIKVGILHSLTGTMAVSESVLKDTVLMLIATRTRKGDCSERNLNRSSLIPRPIGMPMPKRPASC